jgi:single stranded DNA-binding protein
LENTEKLKRYEKAIIDFPDVNRVVIAGDLIFDPPLRWTKRGVPVTNFVISTTPDPNIEEPDELRSKKCFINVVVWAQKAVFCHENLKKGTPVLIIGELQSMPNFAPEKAYYPVQLNAKWIQVLERNKARKTIAAGYQKESGTATSSQSKNAEEEIQQTHETMTTDNLDISESAQTGNSTTDTIEVTEESDQHRDTLPSENSDASKPSQMQNDSTETT